VAVHVGGSRLGREKTAPVRWALRAISVAAWASSKQDGPGPVTSFKLNIGFSNYFHCSEFENTKPILPDVQKF
jgi:hypothetical protein